MLLLKNQTTLLSSVSFSGKGLHSGRMVRMTVKPAPAFSGVQFQRIDNPGSLPVKASVHRVSATALSTTVGIGHESVSTIEHLMAAFAGLGICNVLVQIDGPEVPIMDGSSAAFVRRFMSAGIKELNAPAKAFRLKRTLTIDEGDKFLRLEPSDCQRIRCSIDFKAAVIGIQSLLYNSSLESFLAIADARTFCNLSDVKAMQERGLALGGGLENAIVVSEDGILNEEGLRAPDEFVRHKLLDLIGDFSLLGAPLLADISAHKSGHALHAKAVKQMASDPELYLEEFYPEIGQIALAASLNQLNPASVVSYA